MAMERRHEAGSASIELAIVTVALVGTMTAALDLYQYIRAQAGARRIAQTIAEYVANQAHPRPRLRYAEVSALGSALRRPEIGADNTMVIRLTAMHQGADAGSTPRIEWVSTVEYGNPIESGFLAE